MKLTPYDCSIHTHSAFCDGENSMAEMAEAAFAAGVKYFGVSGHVHTPLPEDEGLCLDADLTAYRQETERLRREYAGRMEILLGIEWDDCSDVPVPEGMDFWIGSVHNLQDRKTGRYHIIDWKPEFLQTCRDEMFGGDMMALVAGYYRAVAGVAEKKPTILAHFDQITKLNGDGAFFDEESPRYRTCALEALHAADPGTTLLEINTGAMARKYRSAPYPAAFLLEEWKRMGGGIIISSDAHSAERILHAYEHAVAAAKRAGFRECMLLTAGGPVACPL